MKPTVKTLSLLIIALSLLLTGCFALQDAEESTGAVVAPTLAPATDAPTAAPIAVATEVVALPTDMPEPVAEPTEVVSENSAESDAPTQPEPVESGATVFTVDPAQSEARFIIEEVLRGADTTVVGVTSNVAGQVALDLSNPAATQVGAIVINARDITTDNRFRNNAIGNEILRTAQFELITFTPTAVTGLPDAVSEGESVSFQIVGDLTITDQTRSVTFDATVTPVSATRLEGLATTTILYADFGLTIPFSQSVDSVEDTVVLEFEFVAVADEAAVPSGENSAESITITYFTPAQQEGPYYTVAKPADRDNDLTVLASAAGSPSGDVLAFGGTVYDRNGQPLPGVLIEIWQTDSAGAYDHPNDPATEQRDRNFQFYGEATTDDAGRYAFRTILPGEYEPRPRHIHVKIKFNERELLTTQFYFAGDPQLGTAADNPNFAPLLIALSDGQDATGGAILVGERDIVLDVDLSG